MTKKTKKEQTKKQPRPTTFEIQIVEKYKDTGRIKDSASQDLEEFAGSVAYLFSNFMRGRFRMLTTTDLLFRRKKSEQAIFEQAKSVGEYLKTHLFFVLQPDKWEKLLEARRKAQKKKAAKKSTKKKTAAKRTRRKK